MLLALNAGTAEIRLGCLERGEVLCAASLETRATRTADEYAVLLERMLALHGVDAGGFEGAALASVVPPLTATLAAAAELVTGCRALVVGAGVKTGLNIGIDDPSQLGADLVAAAVGALERHAPPAIVVDVGTATTFSVLGADGRLLGGCIMPGPVLAADALSAAASLLPRVPFEAPRKCVGTNTADCMRSGAVFGAAAAIDGMVSRIERELGVRGALIATGAHAARVIPHCERAFELDGHAALRGLALIWERNRRQRRQ